MTKQVQRRRGTATQHTSFTGAEGEISVNTTNKSTHVHDGVTAGGIEAARADLDNVDAADVLAAAGITASATELNRVDGVTSPLQAQIDAKAPKNNATFTGSTTIPTADINGGTIDGTVIGGATAAAITGTTLTATGSIVVAGTVDGRDVAADGTKLDGIEASADVTDTANVTAAGALMDSELADVAAVKATTGTFLAADGTKLDGIEASADVTDTANVTAAGALMDSELTAIASVKALNQGVATTDSPTFANITTTTGASVFASLDISGDIDVDGTTNLDVVDIDGAVNMATTALVTGVLTTTAAAVFNGGFATAADVTFGDNDKAIFGAGSDLQIYHDGSDSYIRDTADGVLRIQGAANVQIEGANEENMAVFNQDEGVFLYYNGSLKLATTSTGVDITGTLTSDVLTVDGGAGNSLLNLTPSGTYSTVVNFANNASAFEIISYGSGSVNADNFRIRDNGASRLNIAGNGDVSFYEDTGTTPKFFWDASAESLGIGTSSPDEKLHILGGNILLDNQVSNTSKIIFAHTAPSNRRAYMGAVEDDSGNGNSLIFAPNANGTDGAEAMRIDSSGRVLVGKTTASADGLGVWTSPDGRSWNTIVDSTSNTMHVYNNNESAYKFYVKGNGGINNYSANNSNLSDERAKKDILPAASHWNKVKGLEIVNYKYKTQQDDRDNIGVIAQQVEAVAPEFVDSAGFGDVPDDGIPLKSVYESSLLYAALKALQEAQTRIETLETTVGLMESQLTALEVTP